MERRKRNTTSGGKLQETNDYFPRQLLLQNLEGASGSLPPIRIDAARKGSGPT